MYYVHKMYKVNMYRGVCVYTRLFVCMCVLQLCNSSADFSSRLRS